MIFLISLGISIGFILFFGKALRTHPVPFYWGAVAIALASVLVTWSGIALPTVFAEYILPIFARGGLAGALFVVVMWTGAFPNGSAPIKKLMPIRGQLSILASILTLGHNAAYGRVYFVKLFTNPSALPGNQLLAAVCSVVMLILMLPLFVTSFLRVRRKMNPKTWKLLQRLAYVFYGLLGCHILLLTVLMALRGNGTYRLTVFVYASIFLSYLLCRVSKALAKKSGTAAGLAKKQWGTAVGCMAISGMAVLCMGAGTAGTEPAPPIATPEASPSISSSVPESSVEAEEIPATESSNGYRDGTYIGSAMGMNANIEVSVTIENGQIADVEVVSHRDDEEYYADAVYVIDDILTAGSTQVDTVTGATYSSGGILDAVDDALKQAGG